MARDTSPWPATAAGGFPRTYAVNPVGIGTLTLIAPNDVARLQ